MQDEHACGASECTCSGVCGCNVEERVKMVKKKMISSDTVDVLKGVMEEDAGDK